jgi:Ca2+-binding RTX toxin-like protein
MSPIRFFALTTFSVLALAASTAQADWDKQVLHFDSTKTLLICLDVDDDLQFGELRMNRNGNQIKITIRELRDGDWDIDDFEFDVDEYEQVVVYGGLSSKNQIRGPVHVQDQTDIPLLCVCGGDQDDTLIDGHILYGEGGNDSRFNSDFADGGEGDNFMARTQYGAGQGGADTLIDCFDASGGSGDDLIYCGYYSQGSINHYWEFGSANGDDRNDVIKAWATCLGTINGGAGNDAILDSPFSDLICGGSGNAYVEAGDGSDRVFGGSGNDTLLGESGDALLYGGGGGEGLSGGSGNDLIVPGDQAEFEFAGKGGSGTDTFRVYGTFQIIPWVNDYRASDRDKIEWR